MLIVGQDLRVGYISQDGIHHRLFASESLVLPIDEPKAICTIDARTEVAGEPAPSKSSRRAAG